MRILLENPMTNGSNQRFKELGFCLFWFLFGFLKDKALHINKRQIHNFQQGLIPEVIPVTPNIFSCELGAPKVRDNVTAGSCHGSKNKPCTDIPVIP